MAKRWDVVATIFETRNGEEKKRYHKCGAAFDGEKGLSIKLDSLPTTGWNGWLSLYEPKDKDEAPKAKRADADNDVPW